MGIRFCPDLFLTVFASFAIPATHKTGQNPALSGADLLDLEIAPDAGVSEDG
jgi:hypothetical protein